MALKPPREHENDSSCILHGKAAGHTSEECKALTGLDLTLCKKLMDQKLCLHEVISGKCKYKFCNKQHDIPHSELIRLGFGPLLQQQRRLRIMAPAVSDEDAEGTDIPIPPEPPRQQGLPPPADVQANPRIVYSMLMDTPHDEEYDSEIH